MFGVMSAPSSAYVVTAVFTDDGAPAYLTADGSWSRRLAEAGPVDDEGQKQIVAERAQRDQRAVCDPYAFPVQVKDGAIDPLTTRERIRAEGPTTRLRRPD